MFTESIACVSVRGGTHLVTSQEMAAFDVPLQPSLHPSLAPSLPTSMTAGQVRPHIHTGHTSNVTAIVETPH